jgi:predicted NodU family carbamoyl transferase
MKHGVFNKTWKHNDTACRGKHTIHISRKKHTSRSQVKTMLARFFDYKGIVHQDFTARGQTVNQQCHLEVLTKLQEQGKDLDSALINGFPTMTIPLRTMR